MPVRRTQPPAGLDPAWLTASQAAAYLGVSPRTLAYYKAAGKVHPVYYRARVYYSPQDLDAFAYAAPTEPVSEQA